METSFDMADICSGMGDYCLGSDMGIVHDVSTTFDGFDFHASHDANMNLDDVGGSAHFHDSDGGRFDISVDHNDYSSSLGGHVEGPIGDHCHGGIDVHVDSNGNTKIGGNIHCEAIAFSDLPNDVPSLIDSHAPIILTGTDQLDLYTY